MRGKASGEKPWWKGSWVWPWPGDRASVRSPTPEQGEPCAVASDRGGFAAGEPLEFWPVFEASLRTLGSRKRGPAWERALCR